MLLGTITEARLTKKDVSEMAPEISPDTQYILTIV